MAWTAKEYDRFDVYSGHAALSERRRVIEVLAARGHAPLACVEDDRPHGGAALLIEHLRAYSRPSHAELVQRLRAFTDRPRPVLPRADLSTAPSGRSVGWINPARALLKLPGTASFIHDNTHNTRQQRTSGGRPSTKSNPFEGVIDLAERILAERGDPDGLHELLGVPEVGATGISVEAWYVGEMSPFFRVDINGNHRLAALAILEVPCVLADVQQVAGPYITGREADATDVQYDQMVAYHRLLHVGEAASFEFPGPWPMGPVRTEWPVLLTNTTDACRSLRAVEQLTSSQRPPTIGWLPSELFNDPYTLEEAARQLPTELKRTADQLSRNQQRPWWKVR